MTIACFGHMLTAASSIKLSILSYALDSDENDSELILLCVQVLASLAQDLIVTKRTFGVMSGHRLVQVLIPVLISDLIGFHCFLGGANSVASQQ